MFDQPSTFTRPICAFSAVAHLTMKANSFAATAGDRELTEYMAWVSPPLSGFLDLTGRDFHLDVKALAAVDGHCRTIRISLTDNGSTGTKLLEASRIEIESPTISTMMGEQCNINSSSSTNIRSLTLATTRSQLSRHAFLLMIATMSSPIHQLTIKIVGASFSELETTEWEPLDVLLSSDSFKPLSCLRVSTVIGLSVATAEAPENIKLGLKRLIERGVNLQHAF